MTRMITLRRVALVRFASSALRNMLVCLTCCCRRQFENCGLNQCGGYEVTRGAQLILQCSFVTPPDALCIRKDVFSGKVAIASSMLLVATGHKRAGTRPLCRQGKVLEAEDVRRIRGIAAFIFEYLRSGQGTDLLSAGQSLNSSAPQAYPRQSLNSCFMQKHVSSTCHFGGRISRLMLSPGTRIDGRGPTR
jgi:hypothetical protein